MRDGKKRITQHYSLKYLQSSKVIFEKSIKEREVELGKRQKAGQRLIARSVQRDLTLCAATTSSCYGLNRVTNVISFPPSVVPLQ